MLHEVVCWLKSAVDKVRVWRMSDSSSWNQRLNTYKKRARGENRYGIDGLRRRACLDLLASGRSRGR